MDTDRKWVIVRIDGKIARQFDTLKTCFFIREQTAIFFLAKDLQ